MIMLKQAESALTAKEEALFYLGLEIKKGFPLKSIFQLMIL